ncbi:MAG: alpha/beta hydrolase [Candidatus Nanopelagicales bacterium]
MADTLVLVHGGSHGAWCWDDVRASPALADVPSVALDLPGCGADGSARADLRLDDSVASITRLIDTVPAGEVTLVGHSIGGMVLPAVAAARADRVRAVVFVAAVVLSKGERGIDAIPEDRRPSYYAMAKASGDNSLLPDFANAYARFFPSLSPERAQQVYDRLTPQPFGPYLQPATVGAESLVGDVSYILMENDRTFPEESAMTFAAKARGELIRLPGDHCVMLTDPHLLAVTIREVLTRNRG